MEDKIIMNTVLTASKNLCDIMMHGALESSNKKVKTTFMKNLEKYLELQGSVYKSMEEAGLYTMENVSETKISKACSKFESSLN